MNIIISNLFIINEDHITFKINDEYHPPLPQKVYNILHVPDFYVNTDSTKLIVTILQGEKEDIEVLIVNGTAPRVSYGSTIYYDYKVIFSSLIEKIIIENGEIFEVEYHPEITNDRILNYYSINKIFITEIPKHTLRELEIEKFNQLVDLYREYHNKIIDERFLLGLTEKVKQCYSCLKKEDDNLILMTNKDFYPKFTKHYNSYNYRNVKVYCVINEIFQGHYSLIDADYYQSRFDEWGTGIVMKRFNKNKIDELVKQVTEDYNKGFACFVIFAADPFNNICSNGENASDKLIMNLIRLYNICTVIPDIDMLINIGSKRYVADVQFNQLMLPGTVTYSGNNDINNINEILNLPLDYYIMKQGYSGSGSEFYSWRRSNYQNKYMFIRSSETVLKPRNMEKVNGEQILLDLQDKFNNRIANIKSKRESDVFDEGDNVTCNDFFIIQKYTDLFQHCHEFKFSVVQFPIINNSSNNSSNANNVSSNSSNVNGNNNANNSNVNNSNNRVQYEDKIVCIYTSNIQSISSTKKYITELDELPPINQNIIDFVYRVVDIVKTKWRNYTYLRVDIVCECDPDNKYDILFSQQKVNIYLNEIEHLGSGVKGKCSPIHDKQINIYSYETNEYGYVYDNITSTFMSIIDSKL